MRRPIASIVVVVAALAAALLSIVSTAADAGAQQRQVVVVGDSIILGAQGAMSGAFSEAGWLVTFDAQVNRSTSAGAEVISARAAELTDTLVVNLGANDAGNTAAYRNKVDRILAATAGVPHVYWLTIREVRDYYPAANQAVRDAAASHPNVTVLDWNGATLGRTDLTSSDGLHLNGAGAAEMTNLVVTAAVTGAAPEFTAPPAPSAPPGTAAPVVPPTEVPVTEPPPPVTEVPTTLAPPSTTTTLHITTTTSLRTTRELAGNDDMAIQGRRIDYGNAVSWTLGGGFAVVIAVMAIGGAGVGGWALFKTRSRSGHGAPIDPLDTHES